MISFHSWSHTFQIIRIVIFSITNREKIEREKYNWDVNLVEVWSNYAILRHFLLCRVLSSQLETIAKNLAEPVEALTEFKIPSSSPWKPLRRQIKFITRRLSCAYQDGSASKHSVQRMEICFINETMKMRILKYAFSTVSHHHKLLWMENALFVWRLLFILAQSLHKRVCSFQFHTDALFANRLFKNASC